MASSCGDWAEVKATCPYLSEIQLERIWNRLPKPVNFNQFQFLAELANQQLENGKIALRVGPLFQIQQINVYRIKKRKPVSVWGYIYNQKGYHYKRGLDKIENFGIDGGYLSLVSPSNNCSFFLSSTDLSIDLRGDQGEQLINKNIYLDFSINDYEEVKSKKISQNGVVCIITYVAIPMAVFCDLDFKVFNKQNSGNNSEFINVYGTVSARYKDTYGNYNSEEIMLFEKNSKESEIIGVNDLKSNILENRSCIAVPSYSSLEILINLFNNETKEPLLIERAELDVLSYEGSSKRFQAGGLVFRLSALWHPPRPQLQLKVDECCEGSQVAASHWNIRRHSASLEPSPASLIPSSALEVFSIIFSRKEMKPAHVYGTIHYLTDNDDGEVSSSILRIEENKPFVIIEDKNALPFNGSKELAECYGLKVSVDLKDILSSLHIGGSFELSPSALESDSLKDKFLCSVFKEEKAFVSIHYSILSAALKAKVKVIYNLKTMEQKGNKQFVFGSMSAKYNEFNYSSPYYNKCYGIEIFKTDQDQGEPVEVIDGIVPLSRAEFLVPRNSSIVMNLKLEFENDSCFCEDLVFSTDSSDAILQNDVSILHVRVEWSSFG